MASADSRGRSRPSRPDIVTRMHNESLETPTALSGSLNLSNVNVQEDNSSSSDSDHYPRKEVSMPLPTHGRSFSNPFPSLLHGAKKRQGSTGQVPEDSSWREDGRAMADTSPDKHKRNRAMGSKDYMTGNCMTCASLVRWPKAVRVFKCTICATINDLSPTKIESRPGGILSRRRDDNAKSSASAVTTGSSPSQKISVPHCRHIIRQCLRSYLCQRLATEPNKDVLRDPPGPKHPDEPPYVYRERRPSVPIKDMETEGYEPRFEFNEPPTLTPNPMRVNATPRSYSSSYPERQRLSFHDQAGHRRDPAQNHLTDPKRVFKPLEDYIIDMLSSLDSLGSSFMTQQPTSAERPAAAQSGQIRRKPVPVRDPAVSADDAFQGDTQGQDLVDQLDPKMLLLGDVAENGLWWTGGQPTPRHAKSSSPERLDTSSKRVVFSKSPNIQWSEVGDWYSVVVNPAQGWFAMYEQLSKERPMSTFADGELQRLEEEFLTGQQHTQRVLLKTTEALLKRPGRPITDPADVRSLLIFLENPLLHPNLKDFQGLLQPEKAPTKSQAQGPKRLPSTGLLSGQHSGIIKRIIGLLSNTPADCHNQLISWFCRFSVKRFSSLKELVSGFLSYRLLRQIDKKSHAEVDITAGLIPQMQAGRSAGGSYLHDEIRSTNGQKKKEPVQKIAYIEDWQIKAASRLLALLFAANNHAGRRVGIHTTPSRNPDETTTIGHSREYVGADGKLVPTSDFYNSMIDFADLLSDFESWESKRSKFSFCQYPFLLSIWAKTRILEHDARRQMELKARDAFLDSIMTNRSVKQYLSLTVRRDCLVDDSLNAISEVVGSGSEDIKKALRVTFSGEEGIDGGGLRKEWFLLLIREVFNPDHGMFLYDEDSQYCFFNPNSFEASDQFFLVGVVMGLAIYNSTILDVALPPFAFRKLLAAAPAHGLGLTSRIRPSMHYTLDDLAEYKPRVAKGLRQLLDFEGDVENTFCLDFAVDNDKYGTTVQVPLCPGGESRPVTNANRREYVDAYVRHTLDASVARQFEPFKRGFYTVCGGNAFSLFRPEEIELLIRGSDEPLDISSLRAVAEYDNWGERQPDGQEAIIGWFWETFEGATPQRQRQLLSFITGSDRIPATGAATLPIKLSCLGDDCGRYPIARTCFNLLSLWRYGSKERLEAMLWRAVTESEGFGLK